jgi:hypothetical protein
VALTPLATATDLSDRLGRDLTDSELGRVDALLRDASAAVRRYTGQDITEATSTTSVRVRGGWLRLPQRPVTAVTTVESATGDSVVFDWGGGEEVWVGATTTWDPATLIWPSRLPTRVSVTYTHGYAEIPDDIVAVVCAVALRAVGVDPTDTKYQSEGIASYNYTLGAAAAAGALGSLPAERSILDAYRRPVGVIYMS